MAERIYAHYTTAASAAALKAGSPFDVTRPSPPGRVFAGYSLTTGANKVLGNAFYLAANAEDWSALRIVHQGKGRIIEAGSSREPYRKEKWQAYEAEIKAAQERGEAVVPFFDYKNQEWKAQIGGVEWLQLVPVWYRIQEDARTLVVDSLSEIHYLLNEAKRLGSPHQYWDTEAFWAAIKNGYDVVEFRNVREVLKEDIPDKLFQAVGMDTIAVFNLDVVTMTEDPDIVVAGPVPSETERKVKTL